VKESEPLPEQARDEDLCDIPADLWTTGHCSTATTQEMSREEGGGRETKTYILRKGETQLCHPAGGHTL
jgi:hypothetical protein